MRTRSLCFEFFPLESPKYSAFPKYKVISPFSGEISVGLTGHHFLTSILLITLSIDLGFIKGFKNVKDCLKGGSHL